MATLADEKPYAFVLSAEFAHDYCAYCLNAMTNDSEYFECDDCSDIVTYCSAKCQRKDWETIHMVECEVRRKRTIGGELKPILRLCIRVILQKFGTQPNPDKAFNDAVFEDLETNYDEFMASEYHKKHLTDLLVIIETTGFDVLKRVYNKDLSDVDKQQLTGMICAVLSNSFSLTDEFRCESIGTALYIGISKHNHACSSKNHIVFDKTRAILRAPKGTNYSRNLTISYTNRMLPTFRRQQDLKNVHFFTCECELCKDKEKDAVGLARKCKTRNCKGIVKTFDYMKRDTAKCTECDGKAKIGIAENHDLTTSIIDMLENLRNEDYFEDDTDVMRYLLTRQEGYAEKLADCNVAMLMLNEEIAYLMLKCSKGFVPNEVYVETATKGCEHYISRLGLGAPEVTRRLYFACKALSSRMFLTYRCSDLFEQCFESSKLSHGFDHPLTKEIEQLINENLSFWKGGSSDE